MISIVWTVVECLERKGIDSISGELEVKHNIDATVEPKDVC
jgi:hypothetical protein